MTTDKMEVAGDGDRYKAVLSPHVGWIVRDTCDNGFVMGFQNEAEAVAEARRLNSL